jgi:ribosomal protein S18 acetylase RimI-like enzyme
MYQIRAAHQLEDQNSVWEIFSKVIHAAETYVFDPSTPISVLPEIWFAPSMDTFVAVDKADQIVGTYIIKPNQPGLGSHIANCSFMVHPRHEGKGIGKMMGMHAIQHARSKGYLGIQFNIVVSTNLAAIHLWQKLGFEITGTAKKAFRHPEKGPIDAYVMFLEL